MTVYLQESPDETCRIPQADVNDTSLITLLEYDCIMKIAIGKNNYFEADICPLEMLNAYREWYDSIEIGQMKDFEYITEDDGNNPVLYFKHSEEGWTIHSCWEKYLETKKFTLEEILSFFEMYKKELNKFII